MRILSLIWLVFLAACTPQYGPLTAPETGLDGHFTRQVVISDHAHHVLMGHLIAATRDGTRTRALVINQRRDGVHRLRMAEAWRNGTALPFSATHRRLDGGTHGHCRDHSVGMIFVSDALFHQARIHGLSARLIGTGEPVDIFVPAPLFQALPD